MNQLLAIGHDCYVQPLPGAKRLFRLRIDSAWYAACALALEWCAERGQLTNRELARNLRVILNSYDDLSSMEREVIFTYATHRREA